MYFLNLIFLFLSAINHYLRGNNKHPGFLNSGFPFLDNYITQDIKINCYAIDKFFVEVVYDAKHNVISEVRGFKCGCELDKYAPKID